MKYMLKKNVIDIVVSLKDAFLDCCKRKRSRRKHMHAETEVQLYKHKRNMLNLWPQTNIQITIIPGSCELEPTLNKNI